MTMFQSNTVRQFESLIKFINFSFQLSKLANFDCYEDLVKSVFVQVSGNEDSSSNIVRSKIK
ncbi:hypothetical protein Hanom_Chr04g00361441 [Helianthus anomalus]